MFVPHRGYHLSLTVFNLSLISSEFALVIGLRFSWVPPPICGNTPVRLTNAWPQFGAAVCSLIDNPSSVSLVVQRRSATAAALYLDITVVSSI
ncbi:hypothetical protein EDB83DRAFT_2397035 [Lactarius deliciosus]|nr:hypothetical protein EDB83DRAFT_2397035 [Lactarius deliciosus]